MDMDLYKKCIDTCDEFILLSRKNIEKLIEKKKANDALHSANIHYLRKVGNNVLMLHEFLIGFHVSAGGSQDKQELVDEGNKRNIKHMDVRKKAGKKLLLAYKKFTKIEAESDRTTDKHYCFLQISSN